MTSPIKKNVKTVAGIVLNRMSLTELPAGDDQKDKEKESPSAINVHQLFSLFTADIIKKKSVFVR